MNEEETVNEHQDSLPKELPILPLKGTVIYPGLALPLIVGRERSIKLIDDALAEEKIIGTLTQKDPSVENPNQDELYSIGVAASILKMVRVSEKDVRVVVQGISRIQVDRFVESEPYYRAEISPLEDQDLEGIEVDALMTNVKELFHKVVELSPQVPSNLNTMISNLKAPGMLADFVTSSLNINTEEKQEILETIDVFDRLNRVTEILNRELQVLELGQKIQNQVKEGIDKNQREYYLREQLKAIQQELGETDEQTELEELRERLEQANLPEDAEKAAQKELERLKRMHPSAAEYTVSRTYLDWLLDLPWSVHTEDNLHLGEAQTILDEDHYDLEKIKKRIIEYLAVRQLKQDMKGPILCFVGPPGVGKTSLGRSIARALGRKFVRMSLGGIHDEAEIRGHRRTYIGALPGRIIQGIKKAESNNPLFMLDEVDKLGSDFRGDPSSALLEVLDPEQNFSFSDHYLEVAFDLSKVMFIATANMIQTIPPALLDRMEILELPGYTEEEKLMIAKNFLIPKQLQEHGLQAEHLQFDDNALKVIISSYTREAGVRNLEREIASVCRGVAKEIVDKTVETVNFTEDLVHKYLGPVKFFSEIAERTSEPGVATGLAWTPPGGDIIFVEAAIMPGKKTLTLTGQLGEVMKESAQAALSYVRTKHQELGVEKDFYEHGDIHIHVPAGSIPKDGPSAGVTMFTALTSLLTKRPIRSDVAMTGEITLRGTVLPVGGIKEKVLAARRAGIHTVILPKRNEKDLEDIPENARKDLRFQFVQKMDEIIPLVLAPKVSAKKKQSRSRSARASKG
ncbi:endopeptidase La [candidate division KSB3 bacterium]|uniref:Lon protease n=1 Tax=candidate division KSB3 bacterium TaxID=2044937 RepID=A0A9D5JWX5_9BACT|nr:endopeptidase La [candidate division KSB3 bacterium]MBD3325748.1 endopeptidase La [candidate division KSB3 bacterium]